MTVDVYARIHIHSLEIEAHFLSFVCLAERQYAAIPTFSRGQIGTFVASWSILVKSLENAPIARQRYGLCLGEIAVVQYELPLVVEQLLAFYTHHFRRFRTFLLRLQTDGPHHVVLLNRPILALQDATIITYKHLCCLLVAL